MKKSLHLLGCAWIGVCTAVVGQEFEPARNEEATGQGATGQGAEHDSVLLAQLNDFHLAAWVILENDVQTRVSQVAQDRARDPQVRRFARRMVESHNELMKKLYNPLMDAPQAGGQDRTGNDFDFSRLLETLSQRRGEPRGPIPAARRRPDDPPRPTSPRPADPPEGRPNLEGPRQEVREARQERREKRRESRQSVGRRERVRELFRETIPLVRENLPEILDLLDEAAEDAERDDTGLAFVEFKRQSAERFADSVIREMEREQAKHFDQTYLGFEVLIHLTLIDSLEVAKRYASPELRSILEDATASMHDHLQETRGLMASLSSREEKEALRR